MNEADKSSSLRSIMRAEPDYNERNGGRTALCDVAMVMTGAGY